MKYQTRQTDAYKQPLVSLDRALEEMEERSEREEKANQPNSAECVMNGIDRDYVPSFLR